MHNCQGLGAYMSSTNKCYANGGTCTTVNVATSHDQAISVGPGHNYAIYVLPTPPPTGWTLVAIITSSGDAWKFYDHDGNSGQLASAWESDSTFGSASDLFSDYKGNGWASLPKSQIRIDYNGQHLLTTGSCHAGKTMKQVGDPPLPSPLAALRLLFYSTPRPNFRLTPLCCLLP